MKIFITAIVACVLTLLIVGGLWAYRSAVSKADPPAPVRLERPCRGELVEVVSAPGEVEPMTKLSISARVSARIVEIPCREGQQVTRGDPKADPPVPPSVLVRLDDTDLKAALRSARSRRDAQAAQIEVARARLITQQAAIEACRTSHRDAQRNLQREKELSKSRITSESALEQAQVAVDRLASELAGAENSLKADEKNLLPMQHTLDSLDAEAARCADSLTYTEIVSPIDGVVTRVKAEVGELVVMGTMNNPGTEIMQVANLDNMLVVAQVDEGDVGAIKVGQPARVRAQAYPGRTFEGVVHAVALVQTPPAFGRGKYYEARILLNTGGERIFSGLTADVDIETRRHRDVLTLPSQAVVGRRVDELPAGVRDRGEVEQAKAETPVVYCCRDGKAAVTPVRIGPADSTHTVILSGLGDGDQVIVGPYKVLQGLHNEQKVCDERAGAVAKAAVSSRPAGLAAASRASQPAGVAARPPAPSSQPTTLAVR